MARTTVELELIAIVNDATRTIKAFAADTQKALSGISFAANISAIHDGFELIRDTAGEAFGKVSELLHSSVEAAVEAEASQTKLANAMRITGDYSLAAMESFRSLGEEIARTTTISEDQVIAGASIAKNFQLTNKEAEKLVKTAVDLAAVTGKDLNSAIFELGATFSGVITRDLNKFSPALKALTLQQRASGYAIDIIAQRVKGSGEAISQTFGGSVQQAGNALKRFQEAIGNLIIDNPAVVDAVKVVKDVFEKLTTSIKDNQGTLSNYVLEAVKGIAQLAPVTVKAVKGVDFLLSSISNLFQSTGKLAAGFFAAIEAERQGNSEGARDAAQQSIKEILDLYSGTKDRLSTVYDPLEKGAQEIADKINAIQKKSVENTKKNNDQEVNEAKIKAKRVKQVLEQEQQKLVADILKNPINFVLTPKVQADLKIKDTDLQKIVALGTSAVSAITKGAEGAKQLVSGAIGAVADALVPGLGSVVSEIVNVLSGGPDKVRETVRAFVSAIPDLIKNIILAIPVLIEEIAKAGPAIVKGIIDAIPEIVSGLVSAMPEVAAALAAEMPAIAIQFVTSLIQDIPKIVEGFAREFLKIPEQFVKALLEAIPGGKALTGGGKGGGVGGVLSNIPIVGGFLDSLIPFADGGTVPDLPKLANDRLPARLSGGETVIDKSLTNDLREFIRSGGQQQGPITVVLKVSQQELARTILDLNRNGFRTA